eukprot:scaffold86205_cov25-Tisochrysis_lutea.AAC.1
MLHSVECLHVCVRPQEWHLRLMYMTYEALGAMRISEMFEIVVDYPDSHPAVGQLGQVSSK